MSQTSLVTLNPEEIVKPQDPIKSGLIGLSSGGKASVRWAEENEPEYRPSMDKRDPNGKLKSALNRRVRPLQVEEIKPRISPHIPLTTRKYPERPLIKARFKAPSSLMIITGSNKSILVADRLMRSKSETWIEWFDCSTAADLERSYREFASYIVGGNPEDELWARKAPFMELVQRIASTITLKTKEDEETTASMPALAVPEISTARRPSVATIGSNHGGSSPISLVSESGWGEMENFLFPPESEEGKKRRGSLASTKSVPNLRQILPRQRKPTFVFHRARNDTFELLLHIISAHSGSKFFILLPSGEELDEMLPSRLPQGIDYAILDHPSLSESEATTLLSSETGLATTDATKLVNISGPNFRELHIAAGFLKPDQPATIELPTLLNELETHSNVLSYALKTVRDRSTIELPAWPTLVLCCLISSGPFPIQKLWTVAIELLQYVPEDSPESGANQAIDSEVHPAARMSTPRDTSISAAMTTRVNSCLKFLKGTGMIDLIGWRGNGKATPVTDARVLAPRPVRFAVLSMFQSAGFKDTLPRGDIPTFRKAFFGMLRYVDTRLLFATCWVGPSHLVGILLDMGFSASEPLDGISPLHMAAIGGDVDVASILLAADASVDAQDAEQRTPIFLAVTYSNLDIVRLLLDYGANASVPETGTLATALHVAAASGFTQIVRVLLRGGALRNPALSVDGSTPLHLAIRNGHVDTVIALRQCGASVHVKDAKGMPPMHLAASLGDDAMVKALLDWAAPPNATDSTGHSPLHVACFAGATAVVKTLLDGGALPDMRHAISGDTPLHVAVRSGYLDVVQVLVEDEYVKDLLNSPTDHLFEAVQTSNSNAAKDPAVALCGMPPLHHATRQNRSDIMEALLDGGASINAVSSVASGQVAALHVALGLPDDQDQPLRLLLARGASLTTLDGKRRTAVHHASKLGKPKLLQILLEAGASPEGVPGGSGKTPLHLACGAGHPEVVKILVEKGGKLGVQGSLWKMTASSNKVDPAVIADISEILKRRK
ncbi:hypothetical protein HDU97_003941 [Phlyctochytrium planicorne]|nr:hypothetical protein HDU97_003941 [Phlyctochytrium planicorne]